MPTIPSHPAPRAKPANLSRLYSLIAYVRDQCAKCYGKSVWPGSLNDRHYQGGAGRGRQ